MIRNFATAIALTAALAGCAPATMQELRLKPGGEANFQSPQNYQAVYRTILSNARRCYQAGMITAQMIVQGDLYTDTQTGEVTVALHGGLGVSTYLGVDIKSIGNDVTEVKIFSSSSNLAAAKAIRAWVETKSDSCTV